MSPPYKLVLLGDSSVGKTSLAHRFTTDTFDGQTSNTIGAAFITKEYESSSKKVKFEIWDTAGQERYRSLTPMYYRNAKTALVCFDLSNLQDTFEKAKFWIDQLMIHSSTSTDKINIVLVGTKLDLVDNIDLTEVNAYKASNNLKLYKCSAKSGDGIHTIFTDIVDGLTNQFFDDWEAEQAKKGVESPIKFLEPTSRCC